MVNLREIQVRCPRCGGGLSHRGEGSSSHSCGTRLAVTRIGDLGFCVQLKGASRSRAAFVYKDGELRRST